MSTNTNTQGEPGTTTQAPLVAFTDAAATQVKKMFESDPSKQGMGVRLAVAGGGCSGFSYRFQFDQRREQDHVIAMDGFEVYVDLKSAIYIKGLTVDFQGGLSGRGFAFRNPNATNTCGCGESFSI